MKPIGADLLCRTARPVPQGPGNLPQPHWPQLGLGLVAGPIACRCHPEPRRRRCRALPVPVGPQPGIAWSCRNRSTSLTSQSRFSRPVQQLQLDQSHKLKRTVSPGLVTPRLPPIGFAQSLRGRRMIARCRAWEARGHAGEGGGRYEDAHRCRRRTTSCTC